MISPNPDATDCYSIACRLLTPVLGPDLADQAAQVLADADAFPDEQTLQATYNDGELSGLEQGTDYVLELVSPYLGNHEFADVHLMVRRFLR